MKDILIGTLSLYELFAYFYIYSFLGWIAEVAFHAVGKGKFVNRGFLNGPVCPIYGTGVTLILLILGDYAQKPWAVLLIGIALPTLIELLAGWLLEVIFHNKWWDYSDRRLNFKGYICLEFSVLWGIAAVCVICVLHPAVKWLANLLNNVWALVVVCILSAVFLADLIVTVLQLLKLNRKLKELDEAAQAMRFGSEAIGKRVAEATIAVHGKVEIAKEKLEKAHERALDKIMKKMPKRLLKAFPTLKSRRNPDAVALARERMEQAKEKDEPVAEEVAVSDGNSENREN